MISLMNSSIFNLLDNDYYLAHFDKDSPDHNEINSNVQYLKFHYSELFLGD